jgi:hypothetical protein
MFRMPSGTPLPWLSSGLPTESVIGETGGGPFVEKVLGSTTVKNRLVRIGFAGVIVTEWVFGS